MLSYLCYARLIPAAIRAAFATLSNKEVADNHSQVPVVLLKYAQGMLQYAETRPQSVLTECLIAPYNVLDRMASPDVRLADNLVKSRSDPYEFLFFHIHRISATALHTVS